MRRRQARSESAIARGSATSRSFPCKEACRVWLPSRPDWTSSGRPLGQRPRARFGMASRSSTSGRTPTPAGRPTQQSTPSCRSCRFCLDAAAGLSVRPCPPSLPLVLHRGNGGAHDSGPPAPTYRLRKWSASASAYLPALSSVVVKRFLCASGPVSPLSPVRKLISGLALWTDSGIGSSRSGASSSGCSFCGREANREALRPILRP